MARTLQQQYDDLDAHIVLQEAKILEQYGVGGAAATGRYRELKPLYDERDRLSARLGGAANSATGTGSRRSHAQLVRSP